MMKQRDETIFQDEVRTESVIESEAKKKDLNGTWKKVTIGGVAGIIMGAGVMYAANINTSEDSIDIDETTSEGRSMVSHEASSYIADNGLEIAEVDQKLSFGEAFSAAREEVGAGGVFRWHGRLFNTYTEEEWDNMSNAEHQAFAQQVAQEMQNEAEVEENESNSQDQTTIDLQHIEDQDQHPQAHQVTNNNQEENSEPEVHFLGVHQVQGSDGQTMNVGRMTIGGDEVALVDVDDDLIFDVAISDRNHNEQIDEEEVVDISGRQLTVTDFAVTSSQQGAETAHADMASDQQNDLAEDMPDYMNDVDVQNV